MPWLNIKQNLPGTIKRYFSYNDELYAIVAPADGGTYRIYKLEQARSAGSWDTTTYWLAPAPNDEYILVGAAANPENGFMYVANAAHGEVYLNRTGDFTATSNWETTTGPFAGYAGIEANLGGLIYYNQKVYLAHRGGVSIFNSEQNIDTWEQVADFTEGVEGVGNCTGMHILDGVLYVVVAFGSLYAVYKYNAQVTGLTWIKFAEFPRNVTSDSSVDKPRYLTSRGNILFATDYGIDLNVFNSRGLDTTLTGQPRFTQGTHLDGVPSSILTHTENGLDYVFVTCWDQDFSGQAADAYGENLITSLKTVDVGRKTPGETWFTAFTPASDDAGTVTSTFSDGAFRFSNLHGTVPDPTDASSFKISFHIKTNALTLIPGETYTILWEQAAMAVASTNLRDKGRIPLDERIPGKSYGNTRVNGSAVTEIGFTNLSGDDIDDNSPSSPPIRVGGTLFVTDGGYERASFTFNADDIDFSTTDGSIYIKGVASCKIPLPQLLAGQFTQFRANVAIRNIELYRGTVEEANSTYVEADYVVKPYADIPAAEKDNHMIEPPSPPDQWFLKFSPMNLTEVSGKVERLSRRIVSNGLTLLPNKTYKLHFIVKKLGGTPNKSYRVRTISPLKGIPELSAMCSGVEQRPFVWEFSTAGFTATQLQDIKFEIEVWEEEISPNAGAVIYLSDINIQQRIADTAINTIYRYDGQAWDNTQTSESDDGNVTNQPFGLHKEYETASDAIRLYCIADDVPYVWSTGPNDPFGGETVPRIIMTWDTSDA